MPEQINEKEYSKEMKQSYIDYAMTTITDRALPDVRDGLKPVHRRILYGMKKLGITHDKPHKKSARIVGDVLGKYHPHGDSSVYLAMVRMAQDFNMTVPLVDGHGNFGSIDGDPPAAMRYTEAKLDASSELLMNDLEKDVVDFKPNYDESEREPVVLPARFPNLLINGSEGIATGMKTNIPSHNPTEVANALLYYLQTKKPTIDGILHHLSAPDFPKGGVIINEKAVRDFYKTGYAKMIMRGKYTIENGSYGKTNIVFTELPTSAIGSKTKLINRLITMVNDKVLDEVIDIRDESSRVGIRLVIEVRKGTDISEFINKLWVKTNLQDSEGLQFLVLVNGQPKTLNILEYFDAYVQFQKEITKNRYQFLLDKYQSRLEIVEGLIRAHSQIDAIIDAIKGSKTSHEAKDCLMIGKTDSIDFSLTKHKKTANKFSFTENQALAILNMRLQKLIGLEINKLNDEKTMLNKEMEEANRILTNEKALNKELIKDAKKIKELFPWERRTEVTTASTKQLIKKNTVREIEVTVDRFGYAKLIESFDKKDQSITFHSKATTKDCLTILTNKGMLYQLKLKDVPAAKKKERGIPIQVLCEMESDEMPLFINVSSKIENQLFFFLTKRGKSKLVEGSEFKTNRSKFLGTKLKEGDELLSVNEITTQKEIVAMTKKGRGVRIKTTDIPVSKRNTLGSNMSQLIKDDEFASVHATNDKIEWNGNVLEGKNIPIGIFGGPTKIVK